MAQANGDRLPPAYYIGRRPKTESLVHRNRDIATSQNSHRAGRYITGRYIASALYFES